MTDRLAGVSALVTGGCRGIGLAIVRRFVTEGARCVVADLEPDETAIADLPHEAITLTACDVTSEADVAGAVDLAVRTWGRLDCLVNNAGVLGPTGPLTQTAVEEWDHVVATNLRSVFLGLKHGARVMQPWGSGSIINIASIAGVAGGLGPLAYTAAKHGVVGLTRAAAAELAGDGIRVNAIAPGGVVTALTAEALGGGRWDLDEAASAIARNSPLGRAGQVDDVAWAALYLASDEASYVSGACLTVDAGRTAGAKPREQAD